MYRLMQPSDEAAVLALWQSQHHDTEDFAKMVLERFAGVQNIYVADENDTIVAAALAVPVTLQGRTGNYLCLCGEGSLLLAGLLDTLCTQQKLRGAGLRWQSRQMQHRPLCCRIRALRRPLRCAACPAR